MRASEVEIVNIDLAPKAKYIVAKVSNGTTVVWSGRQYSYHKYIVAALVDSLPHCDDAYVLGGGWIAVDQAAKKMRLYGTSGAFGTEPDRAAAAALVRRQYPDYDVRFDHDYY